MDILIRQRGVVKGKLTSLNKFLSGIQPETVSITMLKVRSDTLETIWTEYNKVQEEIQLTCAEDQLEIQEAEREDFENRYFAAKCSLEDWTKTTQTPNPNQSSQVKLPKLDLPTFGGNYTEWVAFYDLFRVLVHDNSSLGDVQKLQYLKSCLRGEATRLIQALQVTDANYTEAWKLLKERYDNKRQIIAAHFKALLSQPALQKDSANGLRHLLDIYLENMRSLSVLKADNWDNILVYLFSERMDNETRKLWEMTITKNEPSTFNELKSFVQQRCQAIEATSVEKEKPLQVGNNNRGVSVSKPKSTSAFYSSSTSNCTVCNSCHPIYHCDKFIKSAAEERALVAKRNKLCFNCLREGHSAQKCKSGNCRKCGKRHHTLLHFNKQATSTFVVDKPVEGENILSNSEVVSHFTNNSNHNQVLLSTAIVKVQDVRGTTYKCRALLDSGSQANFITESLAKKLKLKGNNQRVAVRGIGSTGTTQSCGTVNFNIQSFTSHFNMDISAVILPEITGILPSRPVIHTDWKYLNDINLADPTFHKPGCVDLLLGADVFSQVIGCGKILGNSDCPSAHSTEFGWIISGSCGSSDETSVAVHLTVLPLTQIEQQLKQFWELEEVKFTTPLSLEEKKCEEHYASTTTRDVTGRYIVELPFNEEKGELGDSKTQAISRLKQVERRLFQQPKLKLQYTTFMQEFLELGHMEVIPPSAIDKPVQQCYYLPHHCVIKDSSSTTKLRVVFDASAVSTSGISLNDKLMSGPTVQQDLISILLRFRTHKVAFTADINKMFRQVLIQPKHQDFQRVLWRSTSDEPIQEYKLKTVTYGTTSAPYLATRTINQLAADEASKFPLASKTALEDFYVDDCMTGADSIPQALELQLQLINLLKAGGFDLHKWSSNSSAILTAVAEQKRERQIPWTLSSGCTDDAVRTLGLLWLPTSDRFSFHVNLSPNNQCTKRSVLSDIARLFDPLGWISPVVLIAKVMLQRLWLLGISWDEELPAEMCAEWLDFKHQLPSLDHLKICRFLGTSGNYQQVIQIHGFCDASESAYGAVIYLRVIDDAGDITVNMLCSKTKVAPLKRVSLPRLELCAAVLLASLVKFVQHSLQLNIESTTAWTDSTITLSWVRGHPNRWKTFVANRVSKIQDIIPPERWNHVGTKENPADCCSRGLTPVQLANHTLWWKGPCWLLEQEHSHTTTKIEEELEDPQVLVEQRSQEDTCFITTTCDAELLQRCSSLTRLVRVTAYVLRFIFNCKVKIADRRMDFISSSELKDALQLWIKYAQEESFKTELSNLLKNKSLPRESSLTALSPFVDVSGLLRVGGRLDNSNLNFDKRHPFLLPRKHRLTELIIIHEHVKHLHAGPTLLLSILRQNFWIINARDVVRQLIHKCIMCFRNRAKISEQLMGQLPTQRVQIARPFLCTGVDYAGPIIIRATTGRGRIRSEKCYIALFICFAVKAIHLELVSDLSTEAFIGALRRFISRRGKCSDIYSDCGSNFVGADRELQELASIVKDHQHNSRVGSFLAAEGINWHFNPPSAPHFGGLWEAGVKSAKYHLRRVLGNNVLTFEQLYTVLTQVEACLNSRPLCQLSSDPSDLSALSPGHFLIGDSLVGVPDPDLTHLKLSMLSKWQLLQKLTQDFWKRWKNEYLSTLQQRPKWMKKQENIKPGELVLVKEEDLPTLKWKLARIIETHPGKDGLVRTVSIKTSSGVFKRPIAKLCRLPFDV